MTREIDPHAITVAEYERLLKHALGQLAGVRGKRALAAREEALALLTNMAGRLAACLRFLDYLRRQAILSGRDGLTLDGCEIDRIDLLLDGLAGALLLPDVDQAGDEEGTVIA